jgi:hypothetical protein
MELETVGVREGVRSRYLHYYWRFLEVCDKAPVPLYYKFQAAERLGSNRGFVIAKTNSLETKYMKPLG